MAGAGKRKERGKEEGEEEEELMKSGGARVEEMPDAFPLLVQKEPLNCSLQGWGGERGRRRG